MNRFITKKIGSSVWRYFILVIVEALLFWGSLGAELEKVTPWLLGINLSIALFSVNFTFFGYQLSKYKVIYTTVTRRQWINIAALLLLPLLPIVIFLFSSSSYSLAALLVLPILVLFAFENAYLTSSYLNPQNIISKNISDESISKYLSTLSKEVDKEIVEHEAYLENRDKFQIPSHAVGFEPGVLGVYDTPHILDH